MFYGFCSRQTVYVDDLPYHLEGLAFHTTQVMCVCPKEVHLQLEWSTKRVCEQGAIGTQCSYIGVGGATGTRARNTGTSGMMPIIDFASRDRASLNKNSANTRPNDKNGNPKIMTRSHPEHCMQRTWATFG